MIDSWDLLTISQVGVSAGTGCHGSIPKSLWQQIFWFHFWIVGGSGDISSIYIYSLWVITWRGLLMSLIFSFLPFAAACHSQDRPTAAVTPIQSGTPVAYLPHLAVCPQPSPSPAQGCTRAGVTMGCAAASLTPPNVSAASLEGDALRPVPVLTVPVGPGNGSAFNPVSNNAAFACRLDKDVKVRFFKLHQNHLYVILHCFCCFK